MPHAAHRLPVLGHQPVLNPPQLVARFSPRIRWKLSQVLQRAPNPPNQFLGHPVIIYLLICGVKLGLPNQSLKLTGRPLRASPDNVLLEAAIDRAIGTKPKGHDFIIDRRHNRPSIGRHMSVTGG